VIPCTWDVVTPPCPDWEARPQATKDSALWLASTFMWAATGRQYGACPITVRPAQERFSETAYREFWLIPGGNGTPAAGMPFLFGGVWRNCGCGSSCCCAPMCSITLRGPVALVDEVLVDGEVVPSSAYRVDVAGGAWHLVRLDGTCWPTCQDFRVAEDAEGAFAVTYHQGTELPEALAIATGLLACEYGRSIDGGACALPARMTRLSRQGVEVEVAPPEPDSGFTGIKAVDDVITALNPAGRRAPWVILSPDMDDCDRVTVIHPGGS
jgi:hypothetical protein